MSRLIGCLTFFPESKIGQILVKFARRERKKIDRELAIISSLFAIVERDHAVKSSGTYIDTI